MNILVAGGGRVATALVEGLRRAGHEVGQWTRREGAGDAAPPEVVPQVAIIAVSDGAVGEVAERLLSEGWAAHSTCFVHTAGSMAPSRAFAGLAGLVRGRGLLHPLRALAGRPEDADFSGCVFGIAGDAVAVERARELASSLGGDPLFLDEEALVRYHAAAVLASNHTLALVAASVGLLVDLGLPRPGAERAMSELLGSAARNLARVGLPAALTGPIVRGDVETVRRHLAALSGETLALYRDTARATLPLARSAAACSSANLDEIAVLLGEGVERSRDLGPREPLGVAGSTGAAGQPDRR